MLFYLVTIIILLLYVVYPSSKWEASVFVFTAFSIQVAILGETEQFLGFIDHRSVVTVMVIIDAFRSKKHIIKSKYLDIYKNIALFLGVFILIVLLRYINIKSSFISGQFELLILFKRIIRDAISFYAIYLIFKRMYDKRTLKGLENGLLLGMIIAIGSIFFTDFFKNVGFEMHQGVIHEGIETRSSGFLGLNANNAGALYNIVYGYILAKSEKRAKMSPKYLIFIVLICTGLLMVASKTGLIVFLVLTLLYMYRTMTSSKTFFIKSILIITISLTLYNLFGDLLRERVRMQITGEFDSLAGRQSYWLMYLKDIYQNPEYLIIGNLGKPTYHRSVHSTYLGYLFYGGIIPISIILFKFWEIYKHRLQFQLNYLYYIPLYSLLALIISWTTGAGSINYWFVLIIGASVGIPENFARLQFEVFK